MDLKVKDLRPGESAEIIGYDGKDAVYRGKLLSMGLTRGTPLTLCKVAPLGDPVEIEVRGFKLSLRKDEADILKLRRKNSGCSTKGCCCR
ncbi:MAG TPA: FeoA family protein [Bacillota bacterium]|nr:FeoA family protein [Bacillota bacterium]